MSSVMLSFEGKKHTTCPIDFVENGNISNILEEAPPLRNKLEFIGQFASRRRAEF